MSKSYYVYIYKHPITEVPFYVGKGKGKRMYQHIKSEKQCASMDLWSEIEDIRNKTGLKPIVEKIMDNLSDNDAISFESQLIILYGRRRFDDGGLLVNIMKNGWADENYKDTLDYKELKRQNTKKLWENDEYRNNVINGIINSYDTDLLEKKSVVMSEKWKDEIYRHKVLNASLTVENNESRRKKSISMWEDSSFRDRMKQIRNTPEFREKICGENSSNVKKRKRYKIRYVDGSEETIQGLNKFCRERGYNSKGLWNVRHKGWRYFNIISMEELM